MKREKVFNSILAIAAVGLLGSMLFDFLTVDVMSGEGALQGFLEHLFGEAPGVKDGKISISGLTLLLGIFTKQKNLQFAEGRAAVGILLKHIQYILLFLMVLALWSLVFAFLKKRWSYLVTAVLSAAGVGMFFGYHYLAVPELIGKVLDEAVRSNTLRSELYQQKIAENAQLFHRSLIWENAGIGFWCCVVLNLVILVVSVAGFVMAGRVVQGAQKEETADKTEQIPRQRKTVEPGIEFMSGEFAGGVITLQPQDTVIVGRDNRVSHVIIVADKISRKHCQICYDDRKDQYLVTDYSLNGTYLEGRKRLEPNREVAVPRGSRISLGTEENMLKLR